MTKREAAIVAAYTGVLIGAFHDLHAYITEIMGRPVFTHELGSETVMNEIKKRARADFLALEIE